MEHAEHRRSADQKFLEGLLDLDDRTLRLMIVAETIVRAGLDLKNSVADVFGRTWEFKIVQALLTYGAMNKSQISSKLFPNLTDSHYKLSRKGPVWMAFKSLLAKGIVNTLDTTGRGEAYDLSPVYRLILRSP